MRSATRTILALAPRGRARAWAGDLATAESDLRQVQHLASLSQSSIWAMFGTAVLATVPAERGEVEAAKTELRAYGLLDGPLPPFTQSMGLVRARMAVHHGRGRWHAAVGGPTA